MSLRLERLLCPILIGREDELAALRHALDRAVQGGVQGIFIAGEAGVGKSRICRALVKEARERGLNPIAGFCAAQDTDLPYGPIVDALRRALARVATDAPALRQALAPTLGALAPLLPELGMTVAEDSSELPAMQRRRLFTALAYTLGTLATYRPDGMLAPAPLVLIVEDVHWADESTLDLLQFLLRSTRDIEEEDETAGRQGMLVVCTFRDEALATLPTLRRDVSALLAERLADQIELHPLTPVLFAQFLEATLDRAVPPDIAAALFERSEGNPFIAEELLSAVAAGGRLDDALGTELDQLHLPLSLHGAVLERLNMLPPETRTLLAAASVVGRVFDLDVLARVTGLDDATLLEGLRLALYGGLIEENIVAGGSATTTTGDRYRFRHALTRDVIYGELLGPERRAWHARVARALEESLEASDAGGDIVEALAYHYRSAGDRVKAPQFALRAAERARTLLSFVEARRRYAEALSYASEHDPARLPLLEALGLLSLALLDVGGAVSYLDEASTLLKTLGLARRAAVVLGEIHHILWYVDLARFRALVEELDGVAEAARTGADGGGAEDVDALLTYAAAALAHATYANYARALVWAQRALDLAARLDEAGSLSLAPSATYKALLARGHALVHGEGPVDVAGQRAVDAGLRDFYQALDLGLKHSLPEAVQLAYNFLPRALLDLGRDVEAARLIDRADEYARRSGVAAIADMRGYSLLYAGRWVEGVAVLREAIAASRAYGAMSKCAMELAALGHVLVAQGEGHAAIENLEEALAILEPSGQFVTVMPCLRALARARALVGDEDGAAALFARAHALWRSTQDRVAVVPLLLEGCLFCAGRGDVQRAAEWADDVERIAGPPATSPVVVAAAAHARGAALAAAGDHVAAQQCLRDAVDRWDTLDRPYEGERARVALGGAILAAAHGDATERATADALLVDAAEGFTRLGAAHDARRVEDMRRRGGLLAQARRRQSLAEGRAPYGDLTPREREVLALLAAGRTNREIAQALFIAEGTAELHVSRILSKLGCATRAQAAAYAVTNRLVDTP